MWLLDAPKSGARIAVARGAEITDVDPMIEAIAGELCLIR